MSDQPKNLQYFLDHPDEMPTDPKEIERLTHEHMDSAMEAGTVELNVDTIVGKPDEPEKAPVKDEKAEATAQADAEAKATADALAADEAKKAEEAKAEPKPEGVLAKDGKHVIPYSQLESARSRAVAAENLAREQATQIAALKAEKAAPAGDAEMLTDEELTALEEDSPTLAKTLRAQQAAIKKLTETVQGMANVQREQVVQQETEVKTEIQTAIDANPTLAIWQTAEDQTMWNEASRFDKLLRGNPKYADVSFEDRFKKVVVLTREALDLEPETPVVDEPKPALTQAEIKAAAQAKLASVQKAKKPLSLSDIPGGAPPAVDERQKVEEMSAVALGQQFLGMTKDQMEAYLSTL